MRSSSSGRRSPSAKAPSQSVRGKLSDRIAQLRQYRDELSQEYPSSGLNTSRDKSLRMSPSASGVSKSRVGKQQQHVPNDTSKVLENVLASQDLDETASNMVKYWLTYQSPTKEKEYDTAEERATVRTMDYRVNRQHIAKALSTIKANQAMTRANRRRVRREESSEDESDLDVKRRARRAERRVMARSGSHREHSDYSDGDRENWRQQPHSSYYNDNNTSNQDIYPSPRRGGEDKATEGVIDAVTTISSWLRSSANALQRKKLGEAMGLIAEASNTSALDRASVVRSGSPPHPNPTPKKSAHTTPAHDPLQEKDIVPSPAHKALSPHAGFTGKSPEAASKEVSELIASGGADHSLLKTTVTLLLEAVEEQGRLKSLLQYSSSADTAEHVDSGSRATQVLSDRHRGLQLEVERLVYQNVKLRDESDRHRLCAEEGQRVIEILKNRLHDAENEAAELRAHNTELRRQLGSRGRLGDTGGGGFVDILPRRGLPPVAPKQQLALHVQEVAIEEEEKEEEEEEDEEQSPSSPNRLGDRLVLSIDVGNGTTSAVTIYRGSNPIALAHEFAVQHGLPESYLQPLAQYISQTKSGHFSPGGSEVWEAAPSTMTPSPTQQVLSPQKNVSFTQQTGEGEDISFNVSESSASPSGHSTAAADSPLSSSSSPFPGADMTIHSSLGAGDIDTSIISYRGVAAADDLKLDETITSNGLYAVPASPPVPPPTSTPPSTASIATPSFADRRHSGGLTVPRLALDGEENHEDDNDDVRLLSAIELRAADSLREKTEIIRVINDTIALKERRAAENAKAAHAVDQDKFTSAIDFFNRATALANDGDLDAAIPLYSHSLDLFRGTGYKEIHLVEEEVSYWTSLARRLSAEKSTASSVASGSSDGRVVRGGRSVRLTEDYGGNDGLSYEAMYSIKVDPPLSRPSATAAEAPPRRATKAVHHRPPPPPLPSTSEFLSPPP